MATLEAQIHSLKTKNAQSTLSNLSFIAFSLKSLSFARFIITRSPFRFYSTPFWILLTFSYIFLNVSSTSRAMKDVILLNMNERCILRAVLISLSIISSTKQILLSYSHNCIKTKLGTLHIKLSIKIKEHTQQEKLGKMESDDFH